MRSGPLAQRNWTQKTPRANLPIWAGHSFNVVADLGLADADKLKIKTGLVIEIRKAMKRLELTQLA